MRVYRSKPVGPRGFSAWRKAKSFRYYACCDCGLTHEVEFKVVDGEVMQRVRRAERYTKAMRARKL